ncbi:aminotransferase class III-fold pyridoxal phosphate-dependent enzyme [Candidatus Neomarinimicrobiota bacterium]
MNINRIKKILKTQYDINPIEIKKLWGYENQNYLVITDSKQFVFKTYLYDDDLLPIIEAENDVLLHLKNNNQDGSPLPIVFDNGSYVKVLDIDGEKRICRLLSYLDGTLLGYITPSKNIFKSLGKFTAQLDLQLQLLNNNTIKARKWHWDIQYLDLNKKYIQDISNSRNRSLVKYFIQQYEENVRSLVPELRKSIIHGDVNEWNILVINDQVTGIFDFGDLAYTQLINELAISITNACLYVDNPVSWAAIIFESYNKILPLEEKEIKILYYLIVARLCISVINSAHTRITDPDNKYTFKSEKLAWKSLYQWLKINPIALENKLRTTVGLNPIKPKPTNRMINERYRVVSSIYSLSYSKPIHMVRSAFQYMYDAHGNTFLDAYNNIPHVGHCHPKVVAAGQRQMAKLNTNTRYIYDLLSEYSEKLLSKFPKSLNKVYFVNSGSAASDLAIRLAQAHTGYRNIMVMEHGYHGNTQTGIDISDYKFNSNNGQGQKEYIHKAIIPDTFRGQYTNNDGNAGERYANDAINMLKTSSDTIAAFISEPILGCAGQVPLAKGYLKKLYPEIRNRGGVCISDEVQTGFGRLGNYFWGFEEHEVIPDIVILGKPMGNGHPLGAVVTSAEIAESFNNGVEFFSSFGGNPVSCAIGLAVLEVLDEENLQNNAKEVGTYYRSLLIELQNEFECIGDIRGSGLFVGVEIIEKNTTKPDTKLASTIKDNLRNKNILISTDGPYDNVLKSKPPLCFTKENAQQVVDGIYNTLKSSYRI